MVGTVITIPIISFLMDYLLVVDVVAKWVNGHDSLQLGRSKPSVPPAPEPFADDRDLIGKVMADDVAAVELDITKAIKRV